MKWRLQKRDQVVVGAAVVLFAVGFVAAPPVTRQARVHGLVRAADRGDATQVRQLLARGTDPNGRDRVGWPVLMHAVYHNRVEAARALLDGGAKVDITGDRKRQEPFLRRTLGSDAAAVEVLIGVKKAEDRAIQDRGSWSWTPLMMAARKGHTEMVRLLLERGANRNATGERGATPLGLAQESGSPETIALFGAARREVNARR